LQAREVPELEAQQWAAKNEKIKASADAYLEQCGLTDAALVKATVRGLELMARGIVSRADHWSARDYEYGRRLALSVLDLVIIFRRSQGGRPRKDGLPPGYGPNSR
jgi:hypothetical protein